MNDIFIEIQKQLQPFLDMSGYEPKTTFWSDYSLAEYCGGEKAVRDTYNRAFEEWKSNVEYITEMVLVLNWKIWYWHDAGNEEMARVYNELWEKADEWCMDNLKDEDLKYFLRTTD